MKGLKDFIAEGADWYWHSTNSEFEKNKVYTYSKRGKGFFGDWEKIFNKYRPSSTQSRLESFYLTKNRNFSEQFGINTYKVIPEGKHSVCALGWLSIIMNQYRDLVSGYIKNYGYKVDMPKDKNTIEDIKALLVSYYSGKPPTAKDLRKYDMDADSETRIIEILASKVRVIGITR